MKALILKTVGPDMKAFGGFLWPESGLVEAPDWNPDPVCGGGLHGLLWGEGDSSLLDWAEGARWIVAEVDADSVVAIGTGKVKVPRAVVVHVGDRYSAPRYVYENGGHGRAIVGLITTAGDGASATAGDYGAATAGDGGTATAGAHGSATAGHDAYATAGDGGTATAGAHGTATAGDYGTATAGDYGTATAGHDAYATAGAHGSATAGAHGSATAGAHGSATAGAHGSATAGDHGSATAGDGGILVGRWWDGKRYRVAVAYVGEGGIKANTPYRINAAGEWVEVAK